MRLFARDNDWRKYQLGTPYNPEYQGGILLERSFTSLGSDAQVSLALPKISFLVIEEGGACFAGAMDCVDFRSPCDLCLGSRRSDLDLRRRDLRLLLLPFGGGGDPAFGVTKGVILLLREEENPPLL